MPGTKVGGVFVSLNLDDRDAIKQLENLRRKIGDANSSLNEKRGKRDSLAVEAAAAAQKYNELAAIAEKALERVNAAKTAIDAGPSKGQMDYYKGELKEAIKEYSQAQKELTKQEALVNKISEAQKKLAQEITVSETKLEKMNEQAANYEKQIAASTGTMAKLQTATAAAAKKFEKTFNRLGAMIRRVFFFSVITRALRALREYFGDLLMSTPEFASALGQLKSALLTLVQPLISIAIPAFVQFLQLVTQIVTALASVVSRLFGTTFEASQEAAAALYDQADAYKKTGSAAKKASAQLAAFDELNVLNNNSGSGGGAASAEAGTPLFNVSALPMDELHNLLKLVEAIGAVIIGWKIGSGLGLDIGKIIGLMMTLYFLTRLVSDFLRTWDEGITWDNLKNLLIDIAGLALGAYLLFGKVGAGIALVLGGLALLTAAFHDMDENGMSLINTLTAIAGLFLMGLGLSVLTGSFVPLALAALGSLLLMLVYLFGEGEEFTAGMRKIFDGLGKFFKSIFSGDVEGAIEGLKLAFEGLKQVSAAVARAVQKAWQALLSWIGEHLGPEWKAFFERIGGYFSRWIEILKEGFDGLIKFLKGVFSGDMELALDGLREIAVAVGHSFMNFVNMLVNGVVDGINVLIKALNSIVGDIPDWLDFASLIIPGLPIAARSLSKMNLIPHWDLPALAQGAVIPPNREFMAVLGDQKSGTNIETPLATMVEAFKQAMGEGSGGDLHVSLYMDGSKITDAVIKNYNRRARAGGRYSTI